MKTPPKMDSLLARYANKARGIRLDQDDLTGNSIVTGQRLNDYLSLESHLPCFAADRPVLIIGPIEDVHLIHKNWKRFAKAARNSMGEQVYLVHSTPNSAWKTFLIWFKKTRKNLSALFRA